MYTIDVLEKGTWRQIISFGNLPETKIQSTLPAFADATDDDEAGLVSRHVCKSQAAVLVSEFANE